MADVYYYYIDEAGDLSCQSTHFLIGCIITDSPEYMQKEIVLLETEIKNRGYFNRFRKEFLKTGFHACTNHPDIYSQFVALLPRLNFRYYAILLDKRSEYYLKSTASQTKEEIYDNMLKSLLKDRILKRKDAINKIFIEQNLPNPTKSRINTREKQLLSIIAQLNDALVKKWFLKKSIRFDISVQNKKTQHLFAVVDFMNHIVMKVYEGKRGKVEKYMKENYRLVEPKIGCIHDIALKEFHKPRKKAVDIENITIW